MNLVVISIDNLRYDGLGWQEDKRELDRHGVAEWLDTPNLDRLAGESLCFTRCISTNTYTTASHASMFTGRYPPGHGVRAFYATKLARVPTLAGLLAAEGYRTILYTDAHELFTPLEMDRGFERVMTRCDDDLFALLRGMKGEKVFLFAHFMDVHEPFMRCEYEYEEGVNRDFCDMVFGLYNQYGVLDPTGREVDETRLRKFPGEHWRTLIRDALPGKPADVLFPLYVKGITKFDRGRFRWFMEHLAGLGLLEGAATAVLSDHGEGRCTHDDKRFFCHAGMLYDNVVRVPLMIRHPGLRPGVEDQIASTVDLCPTLLRLLDIECPPGLDGIDLTSGRRESAYSEHWISSSIVDAALVADLRRKMNGAGPEGGEGPGKDTGRAWPDFQLAQTAMRTETRKYVSWNRGRIEDFLMPEAYELENAEFVRRLYRRILGRFEDEQGYQNFVGLLDTGKITKKNLLAEFLRSKEHRRNEQGLPRNSVYDLRADPEEDRPVDAATDGQASPLFEAMRALSARAVDALKLYEERPQASEEGGGTDGEEEEREMLMSKLKALGYF